MHKNKNRNIQRQHDYKISEQKDAKRKSTMQVFINNNATFCYPRKKKYYSQTLLEELKYEQEKIKMENLSDDDLEKSKSDVSDNDETESDNEFDK